VEFFGSSFCLSIFCLFIYGRASLAMEGKSVVPMEITFMDNGGNIFVLCEFIDYCLDWAKKVSLAAICLVAGSASFGLREN
jgi:hypothetical protein